MANEPNTPDHRWYERRNNIALSNDDFSRETIFDSGIQKINSWINSQPWGVYYSQLVLDFDDEYYRVDGGDTTFASAITHTRAANATMVGSDGVLKWGPHNLLRYSEQVDNDAWFKQNITVSVNEVVAPDGTTTADKIAISTTDNIFHLAGQTIPSGAGTYTFEAFLKAGEENYGLLIVRSNNAAQRFAAAFDLSGNGAVSATLSAGSPTDTTATITPVGNGWYRCAVSINHLVSTGDGLTGVIGPNNNGTLADINGSYAGTIGDGIYAWGAHLYRSDLGGMVDNPERGDSYVPTTASAVYMPRLGHHVWNGTAWVNEGLLHESEARTNLLTHSEDFANAAWGKADTTLGTGIASPDGTTNSKKLIPNTVNQEHRLEDNLTPATGTFTDSIFAKAGEFKNLAIRPVHIGATEGPTQQATFDLIGKTISGVSANCTAQIQDFGNGWVRCSFTYTVSGTITGAYQYRIQVVNNSGSAVFAGDGTSGLFIFGAQREVGPTPSSYIPTSGSAVTRSADVLTIPAANLPYPEPVVIGPELVTNGTFDTDVTGWTAGTGLISVSGGQMTIDRNSATLYDVAYQEITTEIGKVYKLDFDIIDDGVSNLFKMLVRTPAFSLIVNKDVTTGSHTVFFVATTTTSYVHLVPAGAITNTAIVDNISVREINPLALSIQMDGRVTYADDNLAENSRFYRWQADSNNYIYARLNTASAATGKINFFVSSGGVFDGVSSSDTTLSPDVLVPYNVAARHGSTFINGATSGTVLTADLTPSSLPNLSVTNFELGHLYNGTIRTFRMWGQDIGDTGLVEATEPSLVPSLSLTFDGTENSFIVEDWSE
jgi:hypothetical protein